MFKEVPVTDTNNEVTTEVNVEVEITQEIVEEYLAVTYGKKDGTLKVKQLGYAIYHKDRAVAISLAEELYYWINIHDT